MALPFYTDVEVHGTISANTFGNNGTLYKINLNNLISYEKSGTTSGIGESSDFTRQKSYLIPLDILKDYALISFVNVGFKIKLFVSSTGQTYENIELKFDRMNLQNMIYCYRGSPYIIKGSYSYPGDVTVRPCYLALELKSDGLWITFLTGPTDISSIHKFKEVTPYGKKEGYSSSNVDPLLYITQSFQLFSGTIKTPNPSSSESD